MLGDECNMIEGRCGRKNYKNDKGRIEWDLNWKKGKDKGRYRKGYKRWGEEKNWKEY